MTSPHWMTNQDGGNGTTQALKPLVVLDESKLDRRECIGLYEAGFSVTVTDTAVRVRPMMVRPDNFALAANVALKDL